MKAADQTGPAWLPRSDRLVILTAALLVLCTAALAAGLLYLANIQEDAAREGGRARALRAATNALIQTTLSAETNQRGFLLTGDTRFVGPFRQSVADAALHAAQMRELGQGDADWTPLVAQAAEESSHVATALSSPFEARMNGRVGEGETRASALASKRAMDALHITTGVLLRSVERRTDDIRASNAAGRAALYWGGGILAVLSLLSAGLATWAIRFERRSWRDALAVMVEAHKEAEVARAKSAASDLAKTRFLAAASHDMRQPLHALTLYLSALQRRVEGEEARGILAKMERATQSMVGMFNTLLDLARIQADVITPEVVSFPVQEVIDRIVAEHPSANVVAEPTPLQAKTDPVLLERMLRNLVSNALRHGGGGVRVAVAANGAVVEIAVIDQGPGIAPEDQERIFEEFVRLDGRAGAEGLGLGLAIVKRIAALLGAELDLRSAPGKGSTFFVRVPRGAAATDAAAPPPVAPVIAGAPILVMDDDPLALEAAAGALRDAGADVRTCANEAGLRQELDKGFRPQLLVMDLRIDGALTGVDIAERARARLNPSPRVIMMTGDTGADTLATLRASGHAWLIKPVSRDDLAAAVAAERGEVA